MCICSIISCEPDSNNHDSASHLFSESIELDFENVIDDSELSVFDYHYLYNGGGVGVADFDNDGYLDIFLSGNMVSCALLKGSNNLAYNNVTESAGIKTSQWVNGVSIVDINHDGKSDIYLSVGGPNCDNGLCRNLLFINRSENGQILFEEKSETYNLNIDLYSQQGIFFDADLDGDLDLYQLQNYVDPTTKNYPKPKQYFSKKSFDKFYINLEVETGQIKYEDASEKWNVDLPGFGLGVICNDINNDGYPDLYVANDFISDDILYINIDGERFEDRSKTWLKHTTYNSMGVDFGDINEDQQDDILVVDMLPQDNYRQKTMLGSMNYDKYLLSLIEGYNKQFIRNTLQLHPGNNTDNTNPFTDIAPFLDIHQTDWSWSPIITDFDNDGYNDIYISNGYGKNITDLDFVNYNSNLVGFGEKEDMINKIKSDVKNLPDVKLPNQLYINDRTGKFFNFSFSKKSITNGVAYADIDNDGDLDLIENNLNEKSRILINNSQGNNYIKIKLRGFEKNINAIGTKVTCTLTNGKKITRTMSPTRSYLSTMDFVLTFGLGKESVEHLDIKWMDNKRSIIKNPANNQTLLIEYSNSKFVDKIDTTTSTLLNRTSTLITKDKKIGNKHDFSLQRLLFKSCLNENIRMCKSKIDNSLIIANQSEALRELDLSTSVATIIHDFNNEIVTDLIITDNDRSENLYVTTNSNEKGNKAKLYVFEKISNRWKLLQTKKLNEAIYNFASSDDNVFIYARSDANNYPQLSKNELMKISLANNSIILNSIELENYGDISDLSLVDLDGDDKNELIVVGEWQSPKIYSSQEGYYREREYPPFDSLLGYWQCCKVDDLDRDGDLDILLGNLGHNTRLRADIDKPIRIVKNDLNGDGKNDPIMSHRNGKNQEQYTYASRDDIAINLPKLKKSYIDYNTFAKSEYDEIINNLNSEAEYAIINNLSSVILENKGGLEFAIRTLPRSAQLSIINDVEIVDINNDNLKDIIVATNYEDVETHNGSINGLNGLVLLNKGNMQYEALSTTDSGLSIAESMEDIITLDLSSFIISTSKGVYTYSRNN